MRGNVPDDWGMYYSKCGYCGSRVHASEGGCCCLEDAEQCDVCKSSPKRWADSMAEAEGWHQLDDLTEIGDKYFCEAHAECECCGSGTDGVEEEVAKLIWSEEFEQLLCPTCNTEEDHFCEASGPLLDHLASKVSGAE